MAGEPACAREAAAGTAAPALPRPPESLRPEAFADRVVAPGHGPRSAGVYLCSEAAAFVYAGAASRLEPPASFDDAGDVLWWLVGRHWIAVVVIGAW